jgi:3-hydroxyacyl-CoA dehydrogenase
MESTVEMTNTPQTPAGQEAHISFQGRMSYGDYLHLERVLEAREPLSKAHDELLFIIQHQTSELWMKLAIHEIRTSIRAIRHDELQPAFKMLSRVARIFEQLNSAWDVLRTMTPSEYTEFRDAPGQSSGFQSHQYRAIEFLAGNRNLAMLRPHADREDIVARLEDILAEPSLYYEALLLLKRNGFDIGAGLKEMAVSPVEPILPAVVDAIESSIKPVVVAINGTALGGGLEVALAGHMRLADAKARLGLPEVKLGIVPSAGGTQRLPRLAGLTVVARMIGSGQIIAASEAAKFNIVDRIVDDDLIAQSLQAARDLATKGIWQRTGERQPPVLNEAEVDEAVRSVLMKTRGIPAVAESVRLVKLSATVPFPQAVAEKRRTFLALRDSREAAALRHIFLAERGATHIPAIAGIEARQIHRAGTVGIGLMGAGVAVALLNAGLAVVAIENTPEAAESGRARIVEIVEKSVKSGRMSEDERLDRLSRLTIGTEIALLSAVELVIEAVPDDLAIKQDLFKRLAGVVAGDTILATNTSYLDPDMIFASAGNSGRCVGLHFFSPAHVMRLVEVVNCAKTSVETLAAAVALTRRLGKLPVVCEVCEGFVGNRIFLACRQQAEFLLEEGASPKQIDAAMESFGMAFGPFAVFDMAGLEIA